MSTYRSDLPRRRTRRRHPWYVWLMVLPIFAAIVFVVDGAITLAAMWVLTQFGVDAPFWPTFAGVLLLGIITGGGGSSRR
jgi:uncharacterized membrane protein YhaH (DUF805 family)